MGFHCSSPDKKKVKNPINNYYLICPDCLKCSPHIEKFYYDESSKNFLVKYTCICHENTMHSKEASLLNIVTDKEPENECNFHKGNKLINFCKTCRKALCNLCKEELHKGHNIEEDNLKKMISKEDADNMLKTIKEKEKKFNDEIEINEKKLENGIDNIIVKLNEEKINYKKQMENYKDNNKKTFDFLKNLYSRYIISFQNEGNNLNNPKININNDNNINNDIMLTNHINNFKISNNDLPKLNSNIDEIINQYNDGKELKLNYDIGFNNNDLNQTFIKEKEKKNNIINKNEKKEFICIKTLIGHSEKVVSLMELLSGKLLSGSYDHTIRIWNFKNNEPERIIKEKGKVFCFLEFEENKILCGTSENCINLWDISSEDNGFIYSFIGHNLWINSLVKCNNNFFASCSNDANIKVWDYYNRVCKSTLKGHVDCVLTLIKLKNNNLCSGSADLTIRIWDWENCECLVILKGHENWVKCVLELNNGIIISGSDDKTIKLWKDKINIKTLEGHKYSVRTFCQLNDNYFASGSFDKTIKIWDISSWKCIRTLYGHSLNILCLILLNSKNFGNNNIFLASCSSDKSIKIWEGNP